MSETLTFAYRAVARDGSSLRGVVTAADESAAARNLAAQGLTVVDLAPAKAPRSSGRERHLKPAERVLVLRQLALMLEAGVSLLEALDTVANGIRADKTKREFNAVIAGLRRGQPLAQALEDNLTRFPSYVYSMAAVGEASGRIASVLGQAAQQMDYEDRLRRDFTNAMTYPVFLLCAGLSAVAFIFTQVVPRFADMVGEDRTNVPLLSRWVLAAGEFANANLPLVALALGLLVTAGVLIALNPDIRRRAYVAAHGFPVIGDVIRAREVASWARLAAFSLVNDVPILSAMNMARNAVDAGPFRQSLEQLDGDLRAGLTLDESLERHTRLEAMDISLLRAGRKSGSVGVMFGFIADNYDNRLRDSMKRMSALIEPLAIASISIIVGFVALSLVMALSSVYEGVI